VGQTPRLDAGGRFPAPAGGVAERTGLSISLDGIYRWVAFLPSRVDARVPVANRYFGVFQDGSLKVRGIEARRRDTAPWVAETQMALLEHLAQAPEAKSCPSCYQGLWRCSAGHGGLAEWARAPGKTGGRPKVQPRPGSLPHSLPSGAGGSSAPGRSVKDGTGTACAFHLYARGKPGVYAWHLPNPPSVEWVDTARYRTLLVRAGHTVLGPLGIDEQSLFTWAVDNARYPGKLLPQKIHRQLIEAMRYK
jgi:DNA polymerase II